MTDGRIDPLFVSFQEALAGRYSLERELGRGGMGIVYLAREVRLDRPVAIKLLPPEFAANAKLRERFLREARTAARLSHPYIVPIHAVDEVGPFVFYAMAYVDGETVLDRVRREGPMRPADATRILREVAWALAYAHAQGVVHRDIKPANILLERGTERAMVMDFGIARLATASGETGVGEVMGTPEYMSPEQACGEAVDGRSDLYSLGIVGWFMLTGSLPFTGEPRALLAKQVTQPAPPVSTLARSAPRPLAGAIDRCLAKNPAERFATGEALADALAQSLEKRLDVPVPLRVFLDRRRMGMMAMPLGFGMAALGMLARFTPGTERTGLVALVLAGLLVGPVVILLRRLRQLMRHGYGTDDVAAALRTLFERRREEFLYEFGPEPGTRERLMRLAAVGGTVVGGASLFAAFALSDAGGSRGMLMALGMMTGYAGILAWVFSAKWRALREGTGSRFAAFWQSSVGRLLGRIAGHNLPPATIVAADRPTELGIAMNAEAMFAALPREQRKLLGDVPAVLHNLQSSAHRMRVRVAELDASLAEAQGAPARPGTAARQEQLATDLREARAAAERRLSDVVTAMETIRLDLLRLQAGAGSTQSVTQDLAASKLLGEDVDRLLEGQREVDAMIARNTG